MSLEDVNKELAKLRNETTEKLQKIIDVCGSVHISPDSDSLHKCTKYSDPGYAFPPLQPIEKKNKIKTLTNLNT